MKRPFDRTGVLTLLWQQARNLDITEIAPTGAPCSFHITRMGHHHYAVILVRSSDYYERRIHLSRRARPDLIVVWQHDSCLPVEVLSIKTGILSAPYSGPQLIRRTRYSATVLIGQLMCGIQSAFDVVETLPEATKYRYLARLKELAVYRPGRPLKV